MHVTHAIEGSGRDHFTGILTNEHGPHGTAFDESTGVLSQKPGGIGYSPWVATGFQKSVLLGLVKVGALLTEELGPARNLQASYGYGAEIALYTGSRFEFVSKVGYFFWLARIEQNGSITLVPTALKAVYEARGRYCILDFNRFSTGENGTLKMTHGYLAAIAPFHDDMPELTKWEAPTPECTYYVNGIVIMDTRSNKIVGPLHFALLAADDQEFFRFYKRDGLYYIRWNREVLHSIIRWSVNAVS
jgi:hypothetical protein